MNMALVSLTRIENGDSPQRTSDPLSRCVFLLIDSDVRCGESLSPWLARTARVAIVLSFIFCGFHATADGQDSKKTSGLVRPNKDKDKPSSTEKEPENELKLPKYPDMEMPSGEELLSAKPFDWIVLKSFDVLVVEPIGPRPNTLGRLATDYERYLRGKAGYSEGIERLQERRKNFQRLPLTLLDPGVDKDPDYTLDVKSIQKIDYFEDMVLNRTNGLIDAGQIPLAYDLLLLVDRRNRENNVRIKEAYETLKAEESAASIDDDRVKYSVPEQAPLRLQKTWPGFDEVYQRLLFVDAGIRFSKGELDAALALIEDLWDRNSTYFGISERLGKIIDQLVATSVERGNFRKARFYLSRLTARETQHPVATKWKSDLATRTSDLITLAREAAAQGDPELAVSTIERAARVWPETSGLRDVHRELIDRHQSVRLAVMRLPGVPTNYPFATFADSIAQSLMLQPIFEPVRVDERGVRYRSTILESWEPMDLGRQIQFTLRLKRADWEARPIITSADVLDELLRRTDPGQDEYDERLANAIEEISVQSPSQFTIQFRRLPIRLEALFEFPVPLNQESRRLNSDLVEGALLTAGRQRFYEFHRNEREVAFRRVRPQPLTTKTRNIDEIVMVCFNSWEDALRGLLRGEIAGIPQVDYRDLKLLQDDARFFVVPYVLPVSHMILFNPHSAPLRDTQFRRALSLALSRERLVEEIIPEGAPKNLVRLSATPFPSSAYGHNQLLEAPPYDPQRAATLALKVKKQLGNTIPTLRIICPPDPRIRATVTSMVEDWRRIGVAVRLVDDAIEGANGEWDLAYRTTTIIEPITTLWPLLSLQENASIESLRPLPDRVRRQLLDLERVNDWTTATKLLHRIETELLVESRYIPLWEQDEFFVTRRHLIGLPPRLMHAFQDAERWTLQSWYPQESP